MGENPRNFTYDTDGNTVSADAKTFTYNQNSRLIRASENGTVAGEYVYNALGQRVIKTSGGKTAVFLYDQAGNLTAEADETGEILNEYIWLSGRLLASFRKDTAVEAFAETAPDTLNINSRGTLTCFIELPEDMTLLILLLIP